MPAPLAVVVGRGGPFGVRQVLLTLESLVEGWTAVADWRLLLVLPDEPATRELVGSLGGDFEVVWGIEDVDLEVMRRRRAGAVVHILHGGDAAPQMRRPGDPLVVPLVDVMGVDPSGVAPASFTSPSADEGDLRVLWQRDVLPELRHEIVVFTNLTLGEAHRYRAARRVAWLVESPAVYPELTAPLLEDSSVFDLVITSDRELAARLPRAVVVPVGGCWISPGDQRVHPKSRWCSMILSAKQLQQGQVLRHAILPLAHGVDAYGWGALPPRGLGPVGDKADALRDYRFSVAVENCSQDLYFSEKLIDCFRTGTIPVYWGSRAVAEVFDERGILFFDGADDFPDVLARATDEYYESRRDAVEENFHRAAAYRTVERRLAPVLAPLFGSVSTDA